MTPLDKAMEASMLPPTPVGKRAIRDAITAFLEAAAEDGDIAHAVAYAHIDAFDTLDTVAMGRASILALKESVNG